MAYDSFGVELAQLGSSGVEPHAKMNSLCDALNSRYLIWFFIFSLLLLSCKQVHRSDPHELSRRYPNMFLALLLILGLWSVLAIVRPGCAKSDASGRYASYASVGIFAVALGSVLALNRCSISCRRHDRPRGQEPSVGGSDNNQDASLLLGEDVVSDERDALGPVQC